LAWKKKAIVWRRAPPGALATRCGVDTQRSFVQRINASPIFTAIASDR
jgi:hypothetical protein